MKATASTVFRAVLFCILLPSVTSATAGKHRPPGPRDVDPQYLTQPGTAELPLRYQAPPGAAAAARFAYWTNLAWQVVAYDHTAPAQAGLERDAEQLGPTRSSRALAIVHLAIYDAVNAICRRYPGYSGALPAFADSSKDAAIASAAHDALVGLYPRQAARIDAWLSADLARLPAGRATLNGIDVGRRAAAAILALRANDGAYDDDPVVGQGYFPGTAPGQWRPDPVSRIGIALGAYWGRVRPFVLASVAPLRAPPPPPLTSEAYTRAFNEVRQLGGDGIHTPTVRTAEQTRIGIYWAYDGTAWIGTPPRLYSQIALQLALRRTGDPLELARALALVNVAIADATIAVWDTKYAADFWRPVTAVREAGPGSGPSGLGDGNPATVGDPGWTPLGAPASNLMGPNFTPPFPAYTSGHAGLGSATFQVLRRLYGENTAFTFVSDEFNGITRDNRGHVRPLLPRSFSSLSQAEEENGQSRIYLGVHWAFDKTEGSATGRRVADYVVNHGLVRPSN
ncbi:vanadium-dependent haloperoxidase [Massilia sp. DWR3-1-1]|uniref:vanadium-dependent haloperoxidase n=1 Tax=Massilia sp. DWR3-1-1 TaxID=2804559 RepID=UPI003CEA3739